MIEYILMKKTSLYGGYYGTVGYIHYGAIWLFRNFPDDDFREFISADTI